MKFFTTAVVALAAGASAMPWATKSGKNHVAKSEDIVFSIKVSQNPVHKAKADLSHLDICLRVCWAETPQCPNGWYSNNLGTADEPCWTCCKAPEDDL